MAFKNIAPLVNEIYNLSIGKSTGTVVNNQSVVSLGQEIISSNENMEKFMGALVQRIGKVIFVDRKYTSIFKDLELDSYTYGNIVEKISISIGEFEEDKAYTLEDGKSIDPYVVAKPKAVMKLFTTETPYELTITIQRQLIKTSFSSEEGVNKLIATIFTEVENKIELAMEGLGRNVVNNFAVELLGASASTSERVINLLVEYNKSALVPITTRAEALKSLPFLQFASKYIKDVSEYMQAPTNHFNDGTEVRFTTTENQKLYLLTDFVTTLQTEAYAIVYNADWLKLPGFKKIPFLQDFTVKDQIVMNRASDGVKKTLTGVVGIMFDRNALGMFKSEQWTATTPINAKGGYYNISHHFIKQFYNDLTENGLVMTINDVTGS